MSSLRVTAAVRAAVAVAFRCQTESVLIVDVIFERVTGAEQRKTLISVYERLSQVNYWDCLANDCGASRGSEWGACVGASGAMMDCFGTRIVLSSDSGKQKSSAKPPPGQNHLPPLTHQIPPAPPAPPHPTIPAKTPRL